MGIWEIVIGVLVLLMSIVMIIVIILQEGHDAGLGTITGGADSFMKRGKAKTADAMFAKITKFCAIFFFLLIIGLNAISFFVKPKNNNSQQSISANSSVETSAEESKTESSAEESKEESKTESSAEASNEESKTESSAEASNEESKTESSAEASKEESKTESSAAE
jgi:preprotein translocase subunit SecG